MSIAEGVVAVTMPSKFDDSIRIKLEDGDWYSASQQVADGIRRGATVKIKFERKGKNLVIEKAKETAPPAAGGGNNSGGGYRKGGSGGGYKPDPKREESIHYQSSRKDAIEVAKLMQDAGVLKLGAKADLKEGLLLAKIDELTAKFMADIADQGAVKRFNSQADETDEFEPEAEMEQEQESDGFDEEEADEDF